MDLEDSESKAGNRMLVTTWKIAEGPSKGQTIKSWAVLEPEDMTWNFKQLLEAFGHESGTADTDEWIGEYAMLSVIHEARASGSGEQATVAFVTADGASDPEEETPVKRKVAEDEDDAELDPPSRRRREPVRSSKSKTATSVKKRSSTISDDDEDDLPF